MEGDAVNDIVDDMISATVYKVKDNITVAKRNYIRTDTIQNSNNVILPSVQKECRAEKSSYDINKQPGILRRGGANNLRAFRESCEIHVLPST